MRGYLRSETARADIHGMVLTDADALPRAAVVFAQATSDNRGETVSLAVEDIGVQVHVRWSDLAALMEEARGKGRES